MTDDDFEGSIAKATVVIKKSKKEYHNLTSIVEFQKFSWPYLGLKKVEIISNTYDEKMRKEVSKHVVLNTPSILRWIMGKDDMDYLVHATEDLSDLSNTYKIISPMMEEYIHVYGTFHCEAIDENSCKLHLDTRIHIDIFGGSLIESMVVSHLKGALDIWPKLLADWDEHQKQVKSQSK